MSKHNFLENDQILPQDIGRLRELDGHELLNVEEKDKHVSFDQVLKLGKWFLEQKFSTPLPSTRPLPQRLLEAYSLNNSGVFMGKLALGSETSKQYPVTGEVVQTPTGRDIRLHIVPIDFQSLEVAQFEQYTESLLALAAVAAVAPQFILALENGMITTLCSTKKDVVTEVTPDHGSPLAVLFDSFEHRQDTLQNLVHVTGNASLSMKQAGHLHGQSTQQTQKISRSAGGSKIAGGVPIRTLLRSELAQYGVVKHVLYVQTNEDELGNKQLLSMQDSLFQSGLQPMYLPMVAAALGFTQQVVGNSVREQMLEGILQPKNSEVPLSELLLR